MVNWHRARSLMDSMNMCGPRHILAIQGIKSFIAVGSEGDVASRPQYLCQSWIEQKARKFTNSRGETLGGGLVADTVAAFGHFAAIATQGQIVLTDP